MVFGTACGARGPPSAKGGNSENASLCGGRPADEEDVNAAFEFGLMAFAGGDCNGGPVSKPDGAGARTSAPGVPAAPASVALASATSDRDIAVVNVERCKLFLRKVLKPFDKLVNENIKTLSKLACNTLNSDYL